MGYITEEICDENDTWWDWKDGLIVVNEKDRDEESGFLLAEMKQHEWSPTGEIGYPLAPRDGFYAWPSGEWCGVTQRNNCIFREKGAELKGRGKLNVKTCQVPPENREVDIDGNEGPDYMMECMSVGGEVDMEMKSPSGGGASFQRGPVHPWEFYPVGSAEYTRLLNERREGYRKCDIDVIKEMVDESARTVTGARTFNDVMSRCKYVNQGYAREQALREERAAAAAEQSRILELGAEEAKTLRWLFTRDEHGSIPLMYDDENKGPGIVATPGSERKPVFTFETSTTENQNPTGYSNFLKKCLWMCAGSWNCQGVLFDRDGTTCTGKEGPMHGYIDTGLGNTYKWYEKSTSSGIDPEPWNYYHYNMSQLLSIKTETAKAKENKRKEDLSKIFSLSETNRCGGEFMKGWDSSSWDGTPGTGTRKGTRCPGTQCCSEYGYCGGEQGKTSDHCDGTGLDTKYYGDPGAADATKYTHGDERINLETLKPERAVGIGSNFGNYDGLGSAIDDAEKERKRIQLEDDIEYCLDDRADYCKTEDKCKNLKNADGEFVCPQKPIIHDRNLLRSLYELDGLYSHDYKWEYRDNNYVQRTVPFKRLQGYPMIVNKDKSGWNSKDYDVPTGSDEEDAYSYCSQKIKDHYLRSPGFSMWREHSTTTNIQNQQNFKCRIYTDSNEIPDFDDVCVHSPWTDTDCMDKPDNVYGLDVDGVHNDWAVGGLYWRRKTIADMQGDNAVGVSEARQGSLNEPGYLTHPDGKTCVRRMQAVRVDGPKICHEPAHFQGDTYVRAKGCFHNNGWGNNAILRCSDGREINFGTQGTGRYSAENKSRWVDATIIPGNCPNTIRGGDKFNIEILNDCITDGGFGGSQYYYRSD